MRDDTHLGGIDAEVRGQAVARGADEPGRLVYGQHIVVPDASRRRQLDRIMVLDRRGVARVDAGGSLRNRGIEVAGVATLEAFAQAGERLRGRTHVAEFADVRRCFIAGSNRQRGGLRLLERLSHNDGNDLAGVMDLGDASGRSVLFAQPSAMIWPIGATALPTLR